MNTKQSFEALGASCQALVGRSSQRTRAQRLAPNAMTLIELMVVVVILVTLVAGVLPLVSPNNEGRKIQETGRGLQTFLMQAQAEAARIGRPVGVGFRETAPGSGVAIEAFQLVVPKEFAGASSQSRVGVSQVVSPTTYGKNDANPDWNQMDRFGIANKGFYGAKLYEVHSRLALRNASGNIDSDPLPPRMFRVGDRIIANKKTFVIVDDPRNSEFLSISSKLNSTKYLNPAANNDPFKNKLICVWLDEVEQGSAKTPPLASPGSGYEYKIARQPMATGNNEAAPFVTSSSPPYQFPAGVAIDLQASGWEVGAEPDTFTTEWDNNPTNPKGPNYKNATNKNLKQVGLMFSPSGGIESVWVDGQPESNVSKLFLLLGRVENGNPDYGTTYNFSRSGGGTTGGDLSDEEVADRRKLVNWLNLDSRWVFITTSSGRFNVVGNASFDPTDDLYGDISLFSSEDRGQETKIVQIEAAHELAHHHGGAAEPRP